MPFAARRDRLRLLFDPNCEAILVSNPVNVRYLTGFTGGSSVLVVSRSREVLVSDGRFPQQIAEESPGLETYIRSLAETPIEALGKIVVQLRLRNVGIEAKHFTVENFESLKDKAPTANWMLTKGLVEKLRMTKDEVEIASIRRAIATAESTYHDFCSRVQPSDDEFKLTNHIELLTRKYGGQRTAFEPITAVGDRSALAHAPPTSRRVCSGNWLLLDWGAVVEGYHSDLTRILIPHTSPLRTLDAAKPDLDRLRSVYQAVLTAQELAIAALRPGVAAKEIDAAARKSLEDSGYGEYFTHSLGHGIGLDIHEGPGLRATSDETLSAGMVVTIEPGLYFPDWGGIRIEDDVVITDDGMEVLSHLSREFEDAYL